MASARDGDNWLTSKEAEKQLQISGCELMHLREQGKLQFRKQGNAFLYRKQDVDSLRPPDAK